MQGAEYAPRTLTTTLLLLLMKSGCNTSEALEVDERSEDEQGSGSSISLGVVHSDPPRPLLPWARYREIHVGVIEAVP